jgi:hypothetical protein
VLEGIAGTIVWVLANALYVDQKRKGRGGFGRIVLFWMGLPLTWLWLLAVPEGSAPVLEEPPDDAEEILAEIRRQRRLENSSGSDREGSSREDGAGPPPPGSLPADDHPR